MRRILCFVSVLVTAGIVFGLSAEGAVRTQRPIAGSQRAPGDYVGWQVIAAGNVVASSAGHGVTGTIGQTASGMVSSSGHSIEQGFWQSFPTGTSSGCCGLYASGYTGNTDCSTDGKRNLSDITRLIDRVYLSKLALCCEENGNVDGDAMAKLNLGDITKLIDNIYLSKTETAMCQ